MQVARLLDEATARIGAALGLERREARIEARVLASHAWGVDAAWLIAHDRDAVDAAASALYETLLERRLTGEPIAYITGAREFFGRPFSVGSAVLIPRPETELLVEQALLHLPPGVPLRVLDLGAGSGCVAVTLALERPAAEITAVDRSPSALEIATRNAEALGATVRFRLSDWFSALEAETFDLIVGNPPYVAMGDPHLARGDVRFEPRSALAAGTDGLDDLTRIVRAAPAHLSPGGWLWLEHGFDQGDAARSLLQATGFDKVDTRLDAAGQPRISGGQVSEKFTPR